MPKTPPKTAFVNRTRQLKAARHDYASDQRTLCVRCRARLEPSESYRCPYCGKPQQQAKPAVVEEVGNGLSRDHKSTTA